MVVFAAVARERENLKVQSILTRWGGWEGGREGGREREREGEREGRGEGEGEGGGGEGGGGGGGEGEGEGEAGGRGEEPLNHKTQALPFGHVFVT